MTKGLMGLLKFCLVEMFALILKNFFVADKIVL